MNPAERWELAARKIRGLLCEAEFMRPELTKYLDRADAYIREAEGDLKCGTR